MSIFLIVSTSGCPVYESKTIIQKGVSALIFKLRALSLPGDAR
jgi:hypothetical protein